MDRLIGKWWGRLRVRQKVWTVVLVLCVPLISALTLHLILIHQLREVQEEHGQLLLARDQIHILKRLVVDIEDGFRGYLLSEQDVFLEPMRDAEARLGPTGAQTVELVKNLPGLAADIRAVNKRINELLESKHELIQRVQAGRLEEVLQYVREGKGLALSNALRQDLRAIEDRLTLQLDGFRENEEFLAARAFAGLILAVVGGLGLGLLSVRLLTRSITEPLTVLQGTVATFIDSNEAGKSIPISSSDEIGQLARAYEEMAGSIRRYIRELETLNAIGNEINRIGPDGLDGVLRRITERAAEMLSVDVCMVMLRHEVMGCWVVEAASGQWHDRLRKSVMLWEEFPVAVKAFETGSPATGENLRDDHRPEVIRRNLMGQSLLSLPLLSQGRAFGVLVLVMERAIPPSAWNLRLAEGFAEQAAVAVANARLYEAAKEKGKGLELRLKHLEHLAETLAHDMKGPGERMDGLARLTLTKFGHTLEPEAARLLALIQENGQILSEHIETILEVSRVGVGPDTVEAVDPSSVISEVLKEKASELEERQVRVSVDPDFPLVACHRAYLRQVFDNLISNAVKYMGDQPHPTVRIESVRGGDRAQFRVSDNGVGIPPNYRKRVFDPFFRLAAEAKGSGIGLTIVKRIVELYGGEIWIDSTTEQGGCAVAFTLPVLGDLTADSPREGVRW